MFFETLHIRGFGCLRTTIDFAPEKVNLAIANNEAGKSTLVAAILAAFYGLREDDPDDVNGFDNHLPNQDEISHDERPLRDKVIPWTNPEEFGLTLDFTEDRNHWRIERNFHAGTVRLLNRDTGGDRTSEFHRGHGAYMIGEELFGLTCENFLKSFYLRQSEFGDIRNAGGLAPHIQRVATSEEGGVTSENAILRLHNSLARYQLPGQPTGIPVENAISKLAKERESIRSQLRIINNSKTDIISECERLAETQSQIEDIESELEQAEISHEVAEFSELKKSISNQELLVTEKYKLEKKKTELIEYKDFPEGDDDKLLEIVGRIEELRANHQNLKEKLETKVQVQLNQIKENLSGNESIVNIDDAELKQFESGMSLYTDRTERLIKSQTELLEKEEALTERGVDREKLNKFRNVFAGLTTDDKRFIDDYRAGYGIEEAKLHEIKSRNELIDGERDQILSRQKRTGIIVRISLIITALLLTVGVVIAMIITEGWLGQVIIGIGIIFGSVGVIIRGLSSGSDSARLSSITDEIEESTVAEKEAINRLTEMSDKLSELSSKIGFSDSKKFLTVYTNFDRIGELTEPLTQAELAFKEALRDEEAARLRLEPFFQKVDEEMPADETRIEAANNLLLRYQKVFELNSELAEMDKRKEEYQEELDEIDVSLKSNIDVYSKFLRDAGIEEVEPIADAVSLYREKLSNHQKYKLIAESELPRIERNVLPDSQLISKRERLRFLEDRLKRKTKKMPIELSTEEYRAQVEYLSDKKESLNSERQKLQRKIGLVFDSNYSRRSKLLARLSEVESEINRAEIFLKEMEAAKAILDDISQEVYREWAKALSSEAAPIIENLNPRYGDLHFNENLSFSILDRENNKTLSSDNIDSILSTGARDEVFLAARIGMSTYLARGVKGAIPIILDEPMSSTDDEKFLTGMRYILNELSRRHQVLLMSCHQERHNWLSKREIKLFKDRINVIDLSSNSINN